MYDKQLQKLAGCPRFEGAMLAGGAVLSAFTNQQINDFDLYFKSETDFREAIKKAFDKGYWCVGCSKRAVTFSLPDQQIVQMMHFKWFPTAQDVFECFDFTCCMGALDFDLEAAEQDPLCLHDDFIISAAERRLTFNGGTAFPIISTVRALKYQGRGYEINRQQVLAMAIACASLEISSWDELKDQLGGMYGYHIQLQEDGPFSIDAAITALQASVISKASVDDEFDFYEFATIDNGYETATGLLDHLFPPEAQAA